MPKIQLPSFGITHEATHIMLNPTEKPQIIAFDRNQLDDILRHRLARKFTANDDQWNQVYDSIHQDDYAWGYMETAIDNAVDTLVDAIQHELSCH